MSSVTAYPLVWPAGRPRTPGHRRRRASFGKQASKSFRRGYGSAGSYAYKQSLTVEQARVRLVDEIDRLGGSGLVISSDLALRQDGNPRSGQRNPQDPGVAAYFRLQGEPHCLSCDRWDRVADNLAAIAKHVEAVRGQTRWGVADARTMFSGFKTLPPPDGSSTAAPETPRSPDIQTIDDAARFLASVEGWAEGSNVEDEVAYILDGVNNYRMAYRHAAKKLHPDVGGDEAEFKRLQAAKRLLDHHHHGKAL